MGVRSGGLIKSISKIATCPVQFVAANTNSLAKAHFLIVIYGIVSIAFLASDIYYTSKSKLSMIPGVLNSISSLVFWTIILFIIYGKRTHFLKYINI